MFFGWNDEGFIFEQLGWLRRDRLAAFLDSYEVTTDTFDVDLLEPFEDEAVM